MRPILSKSMLPVPLIFAIRPSDNAVVALPNIFGPATVKTVEHTAQNITTNMPALYFAIYFTSVFNDFLRFLGFSPGYGLHAAKEIYKKP